LSGWWEPWHYSVVRTGVCGTEGERQNVADF
jgi:hypothetical protein